MSIEDQLREKLLFAQNKIVTLGFQLEALKRQLRRCQGRSEKTVRCRTSQHRTYVFHVFQGHCFHCNVKLRPDKEFHIDHLWPRSKGGKNGKRNLVLSCAKCDHKKADRLPTFKEIWRCEVAHQTYRAKIEKEKEKNKK